MDNHNNKSLRDHHSYLNRRERENQSFSSTLLDAIYRSIDEGEDDHLVLYGEKTTLRKKQSNCSSSVNSNSAFQDKLEEDGISGLQRRAYMIDQWMEKKVSEKVVLRRKSAADFQRKSRNDDSLFINSSSSSSDSSCGGVFSSSELESVYGGSSRPKPIRTSVSIQSDKLNKRENNYPRPDTTHASHQKSKHEGGFVKTKSRALKIYGDLKKVKQPISPGGRLASFLNSIFTAGNAKKAKISSARSCDDASLERKSKSAQTSTCSSASSFSRSCLSKTPSSRGKSSNGAKRSVRFYPVSVIVDEDCQPCGHKSLHEDEVAVNALRSSMDEELKLHLTEKNRRVEEAARDLLKKYQKSVECELVMRNFRINNSDEEDDDDDDAASCASSDLFELENLSAIGIERYREELPVYETTHFDTNRAIAGGLIV